MSPAAIGTHSALIYRGPDQFVAMVSSLVREGLAFAERTMVVAVPEKLTWLRAELGRDAAAVEFVDSRVTHRPQIRSTQAVLNFVGESRDRPARVLGEQALARRYRLEIEDYLRIEAAANVVYRSHPISVICLYDATVLSEELLLGCLQTHPRLVDDHRITPNAHFVDPASFIAKSSVVVEPPLSASSFNCDGPTDLATARVFVRSAAAHAGFGAEATTGLTAAVTEILTNALVHGSPPCRLHSYPDGPMLIFQVHDSGAGLANPLSGYLPPTEGTAPGRGLWLARQLCDSVAVGTDATGTHVRLLKLLPEDQTADR